MAPTMGFDLYETALESHHHSPSDKVFKNVNKAKI
jgi:hypothetical protein